MAVACMVALFSRLAESAKTARTYQAAVRKTEKSGLLLEEEPLESQGAVWIERPNRYAQELEGPQKTLLPFNEKHIWVYYPDARRVEHMGIEKALKGRSRAKGRAFMSWLLFDLEELEKTYRVQASTGAQPRGVTIRKMKPASENGASAEKSAAPVTPISPGIAATHRTRMSVAAACEDLPARAKAAASLEGSSRRRARIRSKSDSEMRKR